MSNDILKVAKERILVLDGAMGTMIQRHKLDENDFREGWFDNHSQPLKGNNDLLSLFVRRETLNTRLDVLSINSCEMD